MTRVPSTPLALAAACALAACGGGSTVDGTDPVPPGEGKAGGYRVRLVAPGAPAQVGLSALALEVSGPDGALVTDAALELLPLRTTSGGSHRCPVIGPSAAGADGRYPVRAVFQAPSGPGTWTADVAVTRGGAAVSVPLSPFPVVEGKNLAASFESGGTGYVMALEFLMAPRVGVVPVVVTLHETRDGGMTFAPVSDATLGLDPQMPDMGHGGGTGTTAPVFAGPGWYEGALDFTMEGNWTVEVSASRPGGAVGSPVFRVYF